MNYPWRSVLTAQWLLASMLLAFIVGCGDSGPTRYRVKGTVSFKGNPVPAGQIIFEPDSSRKNSGPQGFAQIRAGQYDTGLETGVVGGPHILRITGSQGFSGDDTKPAPELFPEHQMKLDLPREDSVQNIEVPQ